MYCTECGYEKVDHIADKGNTRLYMCPECHFASTKYIETECKHEFNDKNECLHCGKSNNI